MFLTFESIRNEGYFKSISCLEQENSNSECKNGLCALPFYALIYTTCMKRRARFWTLFDQNEALKGTNRSRQLFIHSASMSQEHG